VRGRKGKTTSFPAKFPPLEVAAITERSQDVWDCLGRKEWSGVSKVSTKGMEALQEKGKNKKELSNSGNSLFQPCF